MPLPGQLARARDLLGWSTTTATEKAAITLDQLAQLESDPRPGPGLMALEFAYRDAGVAFAMFTGPSGQIYKTRLGSGPWHHITRRGPMRMKEKV